MQTNLAGFVRNTPEGVEADSILRKCVHCGFCTATCPTYQLLGDELDGPRGRIYLIKQVLEGAQPTQKTQLHLDRCLTCRACESTCPSGVEYGRLADIGREIVERKVTRHPFDKLIHWGLATVLTNKIVFASLLGIGRAVRRFLPAVLRNSIPPPQSPRGKWPAPRHARKMLALAGCVQPSLSPAINAAAARVLDRSGISLLEAPGARCCGALRFHLNDHKGGRDDMRSLIDAWWPHIESGQIEGIAMTASGCGAFVKEYTHYLAGDEHYRAKAALISQLVKDISEVIEPTAATPRGVVAFHSPCSLQHGQQIRGKVEALLRAAGFKLTAVRDPHLCCGSAGTYSILQPDLSDKLRARKIASLSAENPAAIATANIGCLMHLQAGTEIPIRHWIEILDHAQSH